MRDSFSRDFTPAFDVLIVGAGATGALVAPRMAARGLTVVVLESGPRFSGHTALQNAERSQALYVANASAPHELARPGSGSRRTEIGRASVRASDRHQLGGTRRSAGVHLVRLVRIRLPYRCEADRG